jgi:hypothetical protein
VCLDIDDWEPGLRALAYEFDDFVVSMAVIMAQSRDPEVVRPVCEKLVKRSHDKALAKAANNE